MDALPFPGDLLVHLRSFEVLLAHSRSGKNGAFEHAARALGVDRSVLRRRVRALSSWLGAPLLEGRGVELRPTEAGKRVAERASRIGAAALALRTDVAEADERVVVACTGTVSAELLPGVLAQLERRARPVRLTVRRAGGAACEALVREGEVDLGVVRSDAPPRGLASHPLVHDRLWFVVPRDHTLAKGPMPSLAAMASVPLVLYGETSRTRARIMDRLGPHGARVRVEVEGRSSALAYVREGIGATFLSLLPGHRIEMPHVVARDVTRDFAPSGFYVIGRPDRLEAPVIRDVLVQLSRSARKRRAVL
jgi:DNA-binding transcriptional LysR family regulator